MQRYPWFTRYSPSKPQDRMMLDALDQITTEAALMVQTTGCTAEQATKQAWDKVARQYGE